MRVNRRSADRRSTPTIVHHDITGVPRILAVAVLAATITAGQAWAASKVQGRMNSDGVTGRSATPHGWEQEKIYVGQLGVGFGAGAETLHRVPGPPGWFSVSGSYQGSFPGGTYALFTLNFAGRPAFSFRTDLNLPAGSAVVDPVFLTCPAHYSVMYNENYTEWSGEPWIWGTDFYQTFVATSEHITRVATKLAGKGGDHQPLTLNFGVYQTNGGAPSTWPQIGSTRSVFLSGGTDPIIHIFWVPYRSNEMTLIPGQTYAARFWRAPGSASDSFAIVARSDNNTGYAGGHLYSGNTAYTNLDAYAYISGGEPGTVVNYAPLDIQQLSLLTFGTSFGQTFVASGNSLAGADITYATGDPAPPPLQITFKVFDAPGGTQIGPTKVCYGITGFYEGKASVIWQQGNVPLTPGQTYFIQWTSPGANTWRLNENLPGQAYVGGVAQPSYDLLMSIAEFEGDPPPPPVADFSGSPLTGVAPFNVNFTDASTGVVVSRSWSFGDTGTSSDVNPVHTYTAPGSYTVSLTATGPGGNDTETKVNYVVARTNIGDMDGDLDVDLTDFGYFQACLTGPGLGPVTGGCLYADLDLDLDADLEDFGILQGCMSGAGNPADPQCAD